MAEENSTNKPIIQIKQEVINGNYVSYVKY